MEGRLGGCCAYRPYACVLLVAAVAPPAAQLGALNDSQQLGLVWLHLQVGGIEKTAQKSLTDLRYISKKEAITLRSDIAQQLAVAQQQRRAIEKTLWSLTKKGL